VCVCVTLMTAHLGQFGEGELGHYILSIFTSHVLNECLKIANHNCPISCCCLLRLVDAGSPL